MKRTNVILSIVCMMNLVSISLCSAQSLSPKVIASSGGYFTGGGVTLAWTMGETFTQTLSNGNLKLTQGFQQPYIILELTSLNLKAFMEGYYLGASTMQPVLLNQAVAGATVAETDTIIVELRNDVDATILIESKPATLMTNGTAVCTLTTATLGTPYWLVVKHRNTVQTWSMNTITLSSGVNTYDFTTSSNMAYGDNMKDVYNENIWSMYTGDINQDEFIDIFDFPAYDIDNQNFVSFEYVSTDLNGDGFVDIFDFPVYDVNNQNFVSSMHP